jgi:hypothetical protein
MVKKAPSGGVGEGTRSPHRGGGRKATTTDPADPQQMIAELQHQLDECRAELAERNNAFAERIDHQAATIDVLKQMSASPGQGAARHPGCDAVRI